MTQRRFYIGSGFILAVVLLWTGYMLGTSNSLQAPTEPPHKPVIPHQGQQATPNIPAPQIPPVMAPQTLQTPPTAGDIPGNVTEQARAQGYRIIAGFSGTSGKTTEAFTATKGQWIIGWDTQATGGTDGNFSAELIDSNGDPVQLVANVVGTAKQVTYVHQPGTFYLRISSSQPYKLICFEKQ